MKTDDKPTATHAGPETEFSRWRDIKQRFLAVIWHDFGVRFRFLLSVTVFILAAVMAAIFE